jgi:hypothetical protein
VRPAAWRAILIGMPLITVGTDNDTPIESRSSARTTTQEDSDLPEDTTRPTSVPRIIRPITGSLTIAVDAGTAVEYASRTRR